MVLLGFMQSVARWGMWHSSRPFFAFLVCIFQTFFLNLLHKKCLNLWNLFYVCFEIKKKKKKCWREVELIQSWDSGRAQFQTCPVQEQ